MKNDSDIPILYHRIKDNILLKQKLGKGGFGVLYAAENTTTKRQLAIKFERVVGSSGNSNLLKEAKVLHIIQKAKCFGRIQLILGFPTIFYFNKDSKYRYLIMSLLGKNLQKLLDGRSVTRDNEELPIVFLCFEDGHSVNRTAAGRAQPGVHPPRYEARKYLFRIRSERRRVLLDRLRPGQALQRAERSAHPHEGKERTPV